MLPLALPTSPGEKVEPFLAINEQRKQRALMALRCAFVAWVSNVYGDTNDLGVQGGVAYLAASPLTGSLDDADFATLSAANAAGIVAANDERTISPRQRAVDLAVASIKHAANAAELFNGLDGARAIWASVTEDARSLTSRNDIQLIRKPLWLVDVRGDTKFIANFPIWAREPFDAFNKSQALVGSAWGVWLARYRGPPCRTVAEGSREVDPVHHLTLSSPDRKQVSGWVVQIGWWRR